MAPSNSKTSKLKRIRSHRNGDSQHQGGGEEDEFQSLKKSKPNPNPNSISSNLDLILCLKSNSLDDQRKIELTFDFVNSSKNRPHQPVSVSRFASFLSDWIQPLLIARDKTSLDYRCWVILTFSLRNSTVSVSLNLLKSILQVLKNTEDGDSLERKRLIDSSLECFEVILSSNSRAFYNANMDLWKPCAVEICSIIRKISTDDGCGLCRLSVLLLEHFVSFLRFHKDPANIFSKFVDGLVEPLLELLVLLQIRNRDGRLLKLVENVLLNGLFHPVHIGGFFSLRGLDTRQNNWAPKGHREFFKKLGNIIKEKKAMALWGFGSLFRLFVTSAKAHKGAYLSSKSNQALVKINETSDEQQDGSEPLFEVFVQFMHPLFLECKRHSEKELSEFGEDLNDWLLEARGMIKSMNETLMSFIQEKVYVRTEDTPEGAHYKFLEDVYDAIFQLSGKLYQLWLLTLNMDDDRVEKMLHLVAREIVAAIGYFVEIEYKVVDNDLVKLWFMMFSFLTVHILTEENRPSLMTSEILNLGCKLINVYSELRQVNNPLFALCKAVRFLRDAGDADLGDYSMFVSSASLSSHIYINSVEFLLCSQEFQASISAALKSMPEGQAGGFIQHLGTEITDSLQWIRSMFARSDGKDSTEMSYLDMQVELLGRFLSEVYMIVLDSLSVTATNCIPIGNSVKNMMGTTGQHLINLVNHQSGNTDEFIFSITGRKLCGRAISESDLVMSWFFVFFFRIYISCRSLYRQVISLMPPDSSTKAAKSMGIFFSAARECDWKQKPEFMDEGYFSWIVKPSIPLLDVIKLIEDLLSRTSSGCLSLRYVVQIMALQRLNDLNRLITAFEFLKGSKMLKLSEQRKKVRRLVKDYREESTELTNYMTGHPKLFDCKGHNRYSKDDENDSWDLVVCSLNASSLRIAIWRLLCQNFDVWCVHADEKRIEKFLSCLFLYSVQSAKSKEPFTGKITMHHISSEFFTNIASYEQPILHRYFAPRFCHDMKKSVSAMLSYASASKVNLHSKPDWSEFLEMLGKEPLVGIDGSTRYFGVNEEQSCSSNLELEICESLLNLLGKIPKVYIDAKSFPIYATYVLNLEKSAVSNLLIKQDNSFIHNPYLLLRLFLSCRKSIKYLLIAASEDKSGAAESSPISSVFGSSESALWLLKSLSEVVGLPHDLYGKSYSHQVQDAIFSLIDYTSFIFFAISERQFNATEIFLTNDEKFPKENHVDTLEELGKGLLDAFDGSLHALELEADNGVMSYSRLSAEVSCLQGFLWGLASALDSMNEDSSSGNAQFSHFVAGYLLKFRKYITAFENIVKLCFNMLVVDDKDENFRDHNLLHSLTNCDHNDGRNPSGCDSNQSSYKKKQKLSPFDTVSIANGFDAVQTTGLFKQQNFKSLLQNILKGEAPQVAFALRQLFTASAAILKLNKLLSSRYTRSNIYDSKLAANYIGVLIGISDLLLGDMAEMGCKQHRFSFVLLDGVLSFLEIASDLKLTKDVYVRLVDTHLRVIGKCISLQGKSATLSSHETGSNTKMLQSKNESRNSVQFPHHVNFTVVAFISRLRISFIKFIRRSENLYLELALESLEKALVGVQQERNVVSGVNTGNMDGGQVSMIVAAGIDCFDLVLESMSGQALVKEKIHNMVSAVFNVILHLRSPAIFYVQKQFNYESEAKPDAGSVILMCVEILIKVAGNASFQMTHHHVSQCLHVPLILFKGFRQTKPSEDICQNTVDHQFSVELYASCCRLLCTALKHRKSDVESCIVMLQESANVLLNCLEMVDDDLVGGKGFTWKVEEAIKCANFLRRIYEEIRSQKDMFAEYSFYFLSNYICTYCGRGPLKIGLKREVDETLRPGVYSLIDVCSDADFQLIHTSLGEGPCRSTLKTLLHDYKINFQYEGKI